jgi:hypothetical protein
VRNEATVFGQRVTGRSGNFTKRQVVMSKRDQMAIGCDVQLQLIVVSFDRTRTAHFDQFRVNGFGEEMEIHLGNFWSY